MLHGPFADVNPAPRSLETYERGAAGSALVKSDLPGHSDLTGLAVVLHGAHLFICGRLDHFLILGVSEVRSVVLYRPHLVLTDDAEQGSIWIRFHSPV